MRNLSKLSHLIGLLTLGLAYSAQAAEKDWTLLVFLNGNNNLDRFGALDINEMEQVGSTDKINVVVQWASLRAGSTKRVYVKKDDNTNAVTSPVVQDMGRVDMGDWRSLVDFIEWGVKNYPAKRYFVDVWDHGSGWHRLKMMNNGIAPTDISWDDNTGHHITTQQLGDALREGARIIGHKIDLYGSDACLMAMAEVANEVSDSVSFFAGSEEVEPGDGWPYDGVLRRWAATPAIEGGELGKILTEEYIASYSRKLSARGSQGDSEVTFSIFDLNKMDLLNNAVTTFGNKLTQLTADERTKVRTAINSTQSYAYADYGDLLDFVRYVERAGISRIDQQSISAIRNAVSEFVVVNQGTAQYQDSHGVAIWLPASSSTYNTYVTRYKALRFHGNTHWGDVLAEILKK